MTAIIEAIGLTKTFGEVRALDGLDLVAESGRVTALLGPNGAGKTTFVSAVATLLAPTSGELRVAGIDARTHPKQVRRIIGLAGQYASVEPAMTGRENLELVARLFGLDRRAARTAAGEVLERLDAHRGGRPARAHLLRWHASPARPRRQPRRSSPPAAARRADDRARPARPDGALGRDPVPRRRRHRRADDDPVPRGSGPAGPRHRDHRPRPRHRRRNAGGAEEPGRPRRHRGPSPPRRPTWPRSPRSSRPCPSRAPAPTPTPSASPASVDHGAEDLATVVRLLDERSIKVDDVGLRRPTPRRSVPHPHRPSDRTPEGADHDCHRPRPTFATRTRPPTAEPVEQQPATGAELRHHHARARRGARSCSSSARRSCS